jgi:hypothetical protein
MSDDTIFTDDYPPELTGKTFRWIHVNHPDFHYWAAQPGRDGEFGARN